MINPIDTTTLQAARERANLSREELADRAGVDTVTIWRIETGKMDPKVNATWSRIVTALKNCRKRKVVQEALEKGKANG